VCIKSARDNIPVVHVDAVDDWSRSLEPIADYPASGEAVRPIYNHSIVKGGVRNASEVLRALQADPEIAAHYKDFDVSKARLVSFDRPVRAFVSYRIAGMGIFWTKNPVMIAAHEPLLTDGNMYIRTRCGNILSAGAKSPTNQTSEPSDLDNTIDTDDLADDLTGDLPTIPQPGPEDASHSPSTTTLTPPSNPGPPLPPLLPPQDGCTDCFIVTPLPPAPNTPQTQIPEPGTLLMLATGIGGVMIFKLLASQTR